MVLVLMALGSSIPSDAARRAADQILPERLGALGHGSTVSFQRPERRIGGAYLGEHDGQPVEAIELIDEPGRT
jgi:hypothetical protein